MDFIQQIFSLPEINKFIDTISPEIFFRCIGVYSVIVLLLGMSNRVVVYYNGKDFLISFMILTSLGLGYIGVYEYQVSGDVDYNNLSSIQTIIKYTSIAVSILFALKSFQLSYKHNRSIIFALLLFPFKLLISFFGIVLIFAQVDAFRGKTRAKELLIPIIVLGLFIWLGSKLINGKNVYAKKRWEVA
jgi:hypothetical protein